MFLASIKSKFLAMFFREPLKLVASSKRSWNSKYDISLSLSDGFWGNKGVQKIEGKNVVGLAVLVNHKWGGSRSGSDYDKAIMKINPSHTPSHTY